MPYNRIKISTDGYVISAEVPRAIDPSVLGTDLKNYTIENIKGKTIAISHDLNGNKIYFELTGIKDLRGIEPINQVAHSENKKRKSEIFYYIR